MSRRTPFPVRVAAVMTLAAATLVLTSCHQGTPVHPEEAKQAIVTIVERSTDALGGDWTVRSGPGLGKCDQYDGKPGVAWVYIVERAAGDPQADIATLEELWQRRGITTERYQSGGDDPILGIRGVGGPATVIDLNADPRGYSLEGVSECADGDFDTMTVD